VIITSTNRYRIPARASTEVNHGQIIAHFTRIVAAIILITQTKFALIIISPTFGSVVVEDGTGVVKTDADFFGSTGGTESVGAEVDRRQIKTHFIGTITTILHIAQPKLTNFVTAPTFDIPIVEDGAGMIEPTLNCRGRVLVAKPVGTKIDRRQIIAHFTDIIATIVYITQPELAIIVLPPTLDAAVIE
jgi:hypothetical protein